MLNKWMMLLLLCVAAAADASEVKLVVGDTSLRYEMPAGYVRVSEQSQPMFQYLQAALPPTNRLVEAFYTPADIQTLSTHGGASRDTYFMVQAVRSMEHQNLGIADWRRLLPEATAEMGRLDVNAQIAGDTRRNERLSKAAGKPVELEFGKVATPQVYSQTDDEVRFIMLIPLTINVDGKSLAISGVCTGAMILVGNKPLFVYAYRSSSTADDIAIAKQALGAALDALLALNASSDTVDTSVH